MASSGSGFDDELQCSLQFVGHISVETWLLCFLFRFFVFTRRIVLLEELQNLRHSRSRFSGRTKKSLSAGDGSMLAKLLYPDSQCFFPSVGSSRRKAKPSKRGHFCSGKSMPESTACVPAMAWTLRSPFCFLFRIALAASHKPMDSGTYTKTLLIV
jgi:hypothetical protein